jgi:predicted PurR-regulated permease PerM
MEWTERLAILAGIILLAYIMVIGKSILIPLVTAALIAILLNPLVNFLTQKGVPRILSILLSMILALLFLGGIIALFGSQLADFAEEFPSMLKRLRTLSETSLTFMEKQLGITEHEISGYLDQVMGTLISQSGNMAQALVTTTTGFFSFIGLFPIYVFFLLFYKDLYLNFLYKITDDSSDREIDLIVAEISSVLQNYIIGILAVVLILGILNVTGLWIVGIEHALFFGIFAAILALIPYVGILIGGALPFLYGLLMYDSLLIPLGVIIIFSVAQFLEGNFITPNIMGATISLNPIVAIIALLVGGQMWGIAGMILAIPMVGVIKAILDNIEPLEPYGFLLGNQIHPSSEKD